MLLVVGGVSGVGKSTVGALLAEALGLPFYDADDFHPAANIEKMASGQPLDDGDRRPWLETLADQLASWDKQGGAVLACSALKESYRRKLASQCSEDVTWIMLDGSPDLLTARLDSRKGHFFDQSLLESQFADLELPSDGWVVDARSSPEEIVDTILDLLRGK
jgi:6-phosphogluconate dehydrogenase/gluconokinase